MLPPWLRAESHAHRQLNTLPRCMRPDGDGAKRPTTGAGTEAGCVVGASAAGVAMLRALISMRTSIARGRGGGAVAVTRKLSRPRIVRGGLPAQHLNPCPPAQPPKRQKPRQLFATAGVSAEKGDMILERTAKGQTVFAQLLYAPRLAAQSAYSAATQSRYTCDGAVEWCLSLAQAMPRTVPNCRQIRNVPKRQTRVGLLSHLTFRWPRCSSCVPANVGQWRCWFYRQRMCL